MNKINICFWIFVLGLVALAKETEATCKDKFICKWFRPNCRLSKSMCPKTCNACPTGPEEPEKPQCRGGKVFRPCGGCDGTCRNRFPICPAICKPGCVCPKNRVLHKGKCIGLRDCPAPPKCPSNKIYSKCGGCLRTCQNKHLRRPCPTVCRPGCICPRGTVWSGQLLKCVPENQCPEPGESQCRGDKIFYLCGKCDATCDNRFPICPAVCTPGCACPENTVLHQGRCISPLDCPLPESQCGGDKIFYLCGKCDATCDNRFPICPAVCKPGCACPENTVLHQGRCISPLDCPLPETTPEESDEFKLTLPPFADEGLEDDFSHPFQLNHK